jgi:hypothetical protein
MTAFNPNGGKQPLVLKGGGEQADVFVVATDQRFDLSTEGIPSSWHDAAANAPQGTKGPLTKAGPVRLMPNVDSLDLFTSILVATVTCMIGGYLWFELESTSGELHPWSALALGAAIALAVRFGGGSSDHQLRAILSLGIYVAGLTVVLFILGRANYMELYGTTPDFLDFEQHLYHSRLTSFESVAAWFSGALATVILSYLTRSRTS